MIRAVGLSKNFRIYQKEPGLKGSLKSLFLRSYETKHAINPFNLQVDKGEFVGLLGHNGAGKTTLMKMFTGIIVPSGGEISVMGYLPAKRDRLFRKKIALVMGQKSQLWWDLPALDSFHLLQSYYEIEPAPFKKRLNELTDLLGVQKVLKTHVRKLSLGERMKLELISCLLHSPEIIFLDEPTIGLDLVAQNNVREFLQEYQQKHGTTIILTSHYMADIDALCKRVVLIIEGDKRFDGPITQFENLLGPEKVVTFNFSHPIQPKEPFWQEFTPHWNSDFTSVELNIGEKKLREVSQHILSKYPVCDFNTEKMPIERVMKTLLESPQLSQAL
jgi:ABC-2 type transport system ATP-binding protein